jgi:hypothetical protein
MPTTDDDFPKFEEGTLPPLPPIRLPSKPEPGAGTIPPPLPAKPSAPPPKQPQQPTKEKKK